MAESNDRQTDLLEEIKHLLVLQLYYNEVPPLQIAKAARMSPNKIYDLLPKGAKKKGKNMGKRDK